MMEGIIYIKVGGLWSIVVVQVILELVYQSGLSLLLPLCTFEVYIIKNLIHKLCEGSIFLYYVSNLNKRVNCFRVTA